jgi:hypothetical protein
VALAGVETVLSSLDADAVGAVNGVHTLGRLIEIDVEKVVVPASRRRFNDHVDLAESIRLSGLNQPISVTPGNELISGERRLRAYKSLGYPKIPAYVRPISGVIAELAQIDENLKRNELTALERADLERRRKELYVAAHPRRRRGRRRLPVATGRRAKATWRHRVPPRSRRTPPPRPASPNEPSGRTSRSPRG